MEKPLISVIIPAYNHEKFVEEAVRSVIRQTWPNLELLVIDDGSCDGTWDVLQKLRPECESRFERVFFDRQENSGTCVTLNRLLSGAHGTYLFIIASDDVLADAEAIELEAEFLETHPDYVLAVGNNDMIDENANRIAWDRHRNIVSCEAKDAYTDYVSSILRLDQTFFHPEVFGTYESLLVRNYMPNGYLIRRSALPDGDLFTKKAPVEDWYLMLWLARAGKMKYLDKILYRYRWHSGNTVKKIYHMQDMTYRTWLYEKNRLQSEGQTDLLRLLEQHPQLHPVNYMIRCMLHPFAEWVRRMLHLPSHE